MIDPEHITDFNASKSKLQELLCFWVLVAGKTASTISRAWDLILREICKETRCRLPFSAIQHYTVEQLAQKLKKHGVGCHSSKARSLSELARSGMDLKNCTVEQLEEIHGIGRKTSRCFIIHSRRNNVCAGLDTHVLHYLRDLGFEVGKTTPSSQKEYGRVEEIFLSICNVFEMPVAELDLLVWTIYSKKPQLKSSLLDITERGLRSSRFLSIDPGFQPLPNSVGGSDLRRLLD